MITTLTATTTARITSTILADEGAHGRSHVLTLLIACDAEHLEASLEAACGYALERSEHPRCRLVRSALASGAAGDGGGDEGGPEGGYVRGAGYYGGGGE